MAQRHTERCKDCKASVRELLAAEYGEVRTGHRLNLGTLPAAYGNSPYTKDLHAIFVFLQGFRGHDQFVRAHRLPNVDFFVPGPGFILEFDETQHFTPCREESLRRYPQGLALGFRRDRWISLCREVNRPDTNPPYRDEQRAWYDTLRDFAPTVLPLSPTVRLFARDARWCELDAASAADLAAFLSFLQGTSELRR